MELLQFSLLDMTPYDQRSWFNLVAGYLQAIWPFNLLALLFSLAVPALMFKYKALSISGSVSVRLVLTLLGLAWLWCGAVFHWQFFVNLNWAAPWFGWVFIVEGGLLLLTALLLKQSAWIPLFSARSIFAIVLLIAGVIVYPLSGFLEGRTWIQLEWFPLLPASVTLVTFAVLMMLNTCWRHALVIIPLLWGIVSAAFATTLDLLEFYFISGAIIFWLMHLVMKVRSTS